MTKSSKPKNIPGMFKKSFPEKKFNQKILKRIYIMEYKDFILKVFNRDEQGTYTIKTEFTKPEIKKLKQIAKSISRNRGLIQTGKLILLAVILVLVLGFNILFKDALFEKTAESWLEAIFAARADLGSLKFRPEQGRVSFASLAVADSEQPFKNLFELGKTEVYLNLAALLKGKVVIKNIECREIRWNTDRKTSGALAVQAAPGKKEPAVPKLEATEKKSAQKQDTPAFSFDAAALDITTLLKAQQDKIQSLKQIEEASSTITALSAKWRGVADGYKKELEATAALVNTITKLRVRDLKSLAVAQDAYTQITGLLDSTRSLSTKIAGTKTDFTKDLALVDELQQKITAAVKADYENLKALIQLPNTEKQALFADLADEYLEEKLGSLYTYGVKILGYIKKIKPAAPKAKPAKLQGYGGVNVHFPAVQYPQFHLQQAAFSIGDKAALDYLEMNVKNISSDPELTGSPVAFLVKKVAGKEELLLDGIIDSREAAVQPFKLNFQAANFPLAIPALPAILGITDFKSVFSFETDWAIDQAGKMSGSLALRMNEIRVQAAEATNIVTREIGKILMSLDAIDIKADYSMTADKRFQFALDTNVDDIIKERVGRLIQDTVAKAQEQVKAALDGFIGDKLKDNASLYAAYKETRAILDGNLADADKYKQLLEARKQELEKLQQQFTDKAKQLADEQAAKLQSEADKVKDSATNQLNNQVDSLKNKLGF